jgi:hypothetical protein
MKIPVQPYRCPLGRIRPETADLEMVKERGWRDQHILVVNEADERLDFVEREFVRRIGNRLYGRVDGGSRG